MGKRCLLRIEIKIVENYGNTSFWNGPWGIISKVFKVVFEENTLFLLFWTVLVHLVHNGSNMKNSRIQLNLIMMFWIPKSLAAIISNADSTCFVISLSLTTMHFWTLHLISYQLNYRHTLHFECWLSVKLLHHIFQHWTYRNCSDGLCFFLFSSIFHFWCIERDKQSRGQQSVELD